MESHEDTAVLQLQLGLHKASSGFLKGSTSPLLDVHWIPAQQTSVTDLVEPSAGSGSLERQILPGWQRKWQTMPLLRTDPHLGSSWHVLHAAPDNPGSPYAALGTWGNTSGLVVQPPERHIYLNLQNCIYDLQLWCQRGPPPWPRHTETIVGQRELWGFWSEIREWTGLLCIGVVRGIWVFFLSIRLFWTFITSKSQQFKQSNGWRTRN